MRGAERETYNIWTDFGVAIWKIVFIIIAVAICQLLLSSWLSFYAHLSVSLSLSFSLTHIHLLFVQNSISCHCGLISVFIVRLEKSSKIEVFFQMELLVGNFWSHFNANWVFESMYYTHTFSFVLNGRAGKKTFFLLSYTQNQNTLSKWNKWTCVCVRQCVEWIQHKHSAKEKLFESEIKMGKLRDERKKTLISILYWKFVWPKSNHKFQIKSIEHIVLNKY